MSSNKIRIILLVMLGISISLSGYAQDKKKMTVEESVKVGLENSNFLHSSKMNMKYAEAKSKEVNTFRLPSLTFGASYTRLSEVDPFSVSTPFGKFNISPAIFNNYNFKVTLQQPLFTGFKLESNSKMADLSYKASKEDFNSDKNELIYNIKKAYWGLFQANQIKKVTEENVAQVQAHLTDVKNLFDQGLATKNDVLKFQVQL